MILHHWDTDGICSTALLLNIFNNEENFTPKIGNYYLDDEDLNFLRNYKEIKVVDMNLPDAYKICDFARLKIYDHHVGERVKCAEEHYNPSIFGKFYPSATLVIKERFDIPFNYMVALGIVGDNGPKMREDAIIKKFMEKENIKFDDLMKATNLLDSSYKINDRKEVMENVYLVLKGLNEILQNEKLNKNIELIEKEIEKWVAKAKDIGNVITLKMKSDYQIISTVTRRIVWNTGKTALVMNKKKDRDELYLRSMNIDVRKFIEMAKRKKYFAGGKKEAMGAIIPKNEGEKFFEEILEVIK